MMTSREFRRLVVAVSNGYAAADKRVDAGNREEFLRHGKWALGVLKRYFHDKVAEVYHNWQLEGYEQTYKNEPEFCYSAPFVEVKEKGFTLVPSRYIEFVNRDENIDFDTKMKTLQGELKELLAEEEKSKADLLKVLKELGYGID